MLDLYDLRRIQYYVDYDDDPRQEFSGRITDFGDGRWETSERNYSGTQWFVIGGPDDMCIDIIRQALEPISEFLDIQLTSDLILSNNPRSLLEAHGATFVADGWICEEVVAEHRYTAVRYFSLLDMPCGRRVRLLDRETQRGVYRDERAVGMIEWSHPPAE